MSYDYIEFVIIGMLLFVVLGISFLIGFVGKRLL